jgi:threonine synthase
MRYISTRGKTPPQSFEDVLLAGLANDGGLFLPEAWPRIDAEEIASFADAPYADAAFRILSRFAGNSFSAAELKADIDAAYARSMRLLSHLWSRSVPTVSARAVSRADARVQGHRNAGAGPIVCPRAGKRGARVTVVAATSGDTGSAAIAALGGLPNIEVFVIHPKGRVSEVQRRQMTTDAHANVHNIALEGSFDDAQAIVKDLFADTDFAAPRSPDGRQLDQLRTHRGAVRLLFHGGGAIARGARLRRAHRKFRRCVCRRSRDADGAWVEKLVVATNANDILARALHEGVYASGTAQATLSPSMDIQVASNFERALFEASGRDAVWTEQAMGEFAQHPQPPNSRRIFSGTSAAATKPRAVTIPKPWR